MRRPAPSPTDPPGGADPAGVGPPVSFVQLVEGGITPRRADPAALGTLPTAAFRYCEPVRTASGYGWYLFLPIEVTITWRGDDHFVRLRDVPGLEDEYMLQDAIQYPHFAAAFDAAAPAACAGHAPPFLARTTEPDMVQVWTGAFARTRPGWGLHVRGPANLPDRPGHRVLEGVVRTDWWFGPLFANIRIADRDRPVVLRRERPFLQVMPFDRAVEAEAATDPDLRMGLGAMGGGDWDAYHETVVRRMGGPRPPGAYAVEARRRAAEARRG